MKSDQQFELCLKEIEIVQDNIHRFDQNGLTIKSWCLTTWSFITVYALQNTNSVLVWLGAFTVLAFSFTEFVYRRFQVRFIKRSAEIEALLAKGDLRNYKYSVFKTATTVEASSEIKFSLRQPQFLVFYLSLIVLSIFLTIYIVNSNIGGTLPVITATPTISPTATLLPVLTMTP